MHFLHTVICSEYIYLPRVAKVGGDLSFGSRAHRKLQFRLRAAADRHNNMLTILRKYVEGYRGKCWNQSGPTICDGEEICREI